MHRNAVSLIETLALGQASAGQRTRDQLARAVRTWPEQAAACAEALRNRAASFVQIDPTQEDIRHAVGDVLAAKAIETMIALTARSKARGIDFGQAIRA